VNPHPLAGGRVVERTLPDEAHSDAAADLLLRLIRSSDDALANRLGWRKLGDLS